MRSALTPNATLVAGALAPRRSQGLVLVAAMLGACGTSHVSSLDAAIGDVGIDAARVDAGTDAPDAWLDPSQIGQVATSCGAADQGLTPVDCTREGDTDAYCVFGNHCACTTGFVCERPGAIVGVECEAGSICIPAP